MWAAVGIEDGSPRISPQLHGVPIWCAR
jgi:hypothetical protein